MESKFKLFYDKMQSIDLPKLAIDTFEFYYNQLVKGFCGYLSEDEIVPVIKLPNYNEIKGNHFSNGEAAIKNCVLIKLNGGLGTSMGLSKAKSLLKVKNDFTFLDIIANQALISKIPLVLLNSFNTQEDSLNLLKTYSELQNKIPIDFLQHKVPKINANDLTPVNFPKNPELEWYPPGHGEIYTALVTSGMLDTLLQNNFKYAFISNADNLGAVIDKDILGYFSQQNIPFLMEVAERTPADKKGGHLTKLKNGQLILRESAQCQNTDLNEFQNIQKHKYFNTNNIWINLLQLKNKLFEKNNILGLPMIVNKKTVDPRNPHSTEIIQLETAMGSAISIFENSSALIVPRTRFAPVKTTEDLLAVRSDNYILTDDFKIMQNPNRKLKSLIIHLDSKFYKLIDDLDKRFPIPPSLIDCEELKIKGDYHFGKNIKLNGKVHLENTTDKQIYIEDNTILTND